MLIDFNELSEITIPNMNGGEGKVIKINYHFLHPIERILEKFLKVLF